MGFDFLIGYFGAVSI